MVTWKGKADCYAVYRAVENDAEYHLLGYTQNTNFVDEAFGRDNKSRLTYKVTALDELHKSESKGAVVFLSPATRLEEERYQHIIRQMNLYG
jgi:fibronectin type 3 domain-containing protein